jgi:SAM-dependent methyltransferase
LFLDTAAVSAKQACLQEAGHRALELIQASLVREPRTILDFACGYGRVLRWLRAAYPGVQITACDLFPPIVGFCEREFGALPVVTPGDPESLRIGTFDLIWVGSLLSHVDADWWRRFLTFFHRSLSEHGVLVFTTHGPTVAQGQRTRENMMRLSEAHLEKVLADYDLQGFGYWPTITEDHGDCLASEDWVRRTVTDAGLSLLNYSEAAWLSQDVIAAGKGDRAETTLV